MAESDSQKLGQYTILEKIAQGGMAQVFKAKTVDPNGIERLVVIKRILPHISSNPEYVEMLINEAKVAVYFTHGNIAQIYDLGRINDDYFIVMEYVDGKTLSHINKMLIEKGKKFPLDILLYCFIELCRGLGYIHRKTDADGKKLNIVHRDISPQNIILSYAGNIKVIDFGVAKLGVREEKTESGVLKGKFAYMSPEQSRGEEIDYRSDIFSIGTLLWEMATGERLFKRKNNQETLKAVQKAKFDLPSSKLSSLPKELDKITKKALQKSPKSRYNDCDEIAADLEKMLFTYYPEFKAIQAAKFIYDLFGPDKDESALPPPSFASPKESLPAVAKSVVRSREDSEVPTVKENPDHKTPVERVIRPKKKYLSSIGMVLFILVIFLGGSYYAYYVHQENQKAFLTFEGLDEEMNLTIDEQPMDLDLESVVVQAAEPHEIKVTKKGYFDFIQTVTLGSRESRNLILSLVKIIPPFGDLTIETTPANALVYLDDMEWREKTPVRINHLKSQKKYKITLSLENYKTQTREVEILGGKEIKLDQSLEIDYATLDITSTPSEATVLFDDQEVGKTPYHSSLIMPGESIQLSVVKANSKTETQNLNLQPGEVKVLSLTLE